MLGTAGPKSRVGKRGRSKAAAGPAAAGGRSPGGDSPVAVLDQTALVDTWKVNVGLAAAAAAGALAAPIAAAAAVVVVAAGGCSLGHHSYEVVTVRALT
jgi:hypothetical protein